MRRVLSGAAATGLALIATLLLVAYGQARPSATTLRLDGVAFRPELALNTQTRARGLMNRRPAPKDGMLFVFPRPSSSGFWMKNTLVPLRIVFYDAGGEPVRTFTMTPCQRDPCKIYDPGRLYRFALELRATDPRPAKTLGPRGELRRLIGLAR